MRKPAALLTATVTLAAPAAAWAHAGRAHDPWAWSFDPWAMGPLALAAAAYTVALIRLRRSAGGGRAIRRRHVLAFAAGLSALLIALASPIDGMSDVLFSAHMVQHLLLMMVAAPLCVYGRAGVMFLWAVPRRLRRPAGRWVAHGAAGQTLALLAHPLCVWILFSGAFVFWHLPAPYEWALADGMVHAVEHLSFFLTAYAFWSVVIEPSGRRRLDYGATLLFVTTAAILGGLPGALLIFAPLPLYDVHAAGAASWGLTLVEDQQLAGVIMWVPAGLAYLAAAAALFLLWLRAAERRATGRLRRAVLPIAVLLVLLVALPACRQESDEAVLADVGGDPGAGADRIGAFGCGGCHIIPGIADANGLVGPPLNKMGRRIYIAGLLRNTPENMVAWITDPQAIVPGNAMPDMGITEAQARDIAAYLYTLR